MLEIRRFMDQMGDVLFVRSETNGVAESSMNEDDAWDDTALIVAYDHAVNLAKDEVMRRMGLGSMEASSVQTTSAVSKNSTHHKKSNKAKNAAKPNPWAVGDSCRCVFAVDGLSYEACIIQINPTGTCVVKYVGYDNEEEVEMKSLQFSNGYAARLRQAEEARANIECADSGNDGNEVDQESTSASSQNGFKPRSKQHMFKDQSKLHKKWRPTMNSFPMMFPPPPPPHILASHEFIDDSEAMSNMLMSWYMSGFHTGFYQGAKQSAQHKVSKCSCHHKH